MQGDAAGKMVHDQLEQLQEQHQLLASQLQEERQRKRGLETVLKREQVRIEELERRLREHETCARETLGVSRELELRAERVSEFDLFLVSFHHNQNAKVKREETRLEELTASLREQEQRLKRERQAVRRRLSNTSILLNAFYCRTQGTWQEGRMLLRRKILETRRRALFSQALGDFPRTARKMLLR